MRIRRSGRPCLPPLRPFRLSRRQRLRLKLLAILLVLLGLLTPSWLFLRKLSGQIALSDATDLITLTINDAIREKMAQGEFDYSYFVTLERDAQGDIAAITTNMARVNTLSSELVREIVDAGNSGALDIRIPLGNLTGFNLLVGKGPEIPVRIVMLTSSHAAFRNEFSSAGINQSKHQILLDLVVEIDVLIPWETLSTQVSSEVLVAETILVGKVPDSYFLSDSDEGSLNYGYQTRN